MLGCLQRLELLLSPGSNQLECRAVVANPEVIWFARYWITVVLCPVALEL